MNPKEMMMDFNLEECTSKTPVGARCQLRVGALTPTQNAVGLDEVNDKVARYSAKSKDDLKDYLMVHPVPIVIGNGGKFYLTDHHHLANALWKTAKGKNKAGIDTKNARVVVNVLNNIADLKGYHFWKVMHKDRLVYLYDHYGAGPIRPKDLLPHVKDLLNDPYRSLAWMVRTRYGYLKDPHAFAEFLWADFFRIRIIIDDWILKDKIRESEVLISNLPEDQRKDLIDLAMAWAKSPEARGMPGYLGPH
jgi:hypothetical protein